MKLKIDEFLLCAVFWFFLAILLITQFHNQLQKEDYMEEVKKIDTDKITSISGTVAVVCGALMTTGLLVPGTVVYIATVGIGTIAGTIFAWFTNKPSPFPKPEEKK